jgi:hypothetical protein
LVEEVNQHTTNPLRRKELFLAICNNKNMIYQDFDFYMRLPDDEFSEYLNDPDRRSREKKELKEKNTKKRKASILESIDEKNETKRKKDEHQAVEEVEKKKPIIQNKQPITDDNAPSKTSVQDSNKKTTTDELVSKSPPEVEKVAKKTPVIQKTPSPSVNNVAPKKTSMKDPNEKPPTEELVSRTRSAKRNKENPVEKEEQLQKIETKKYLVFTNVQPINRFKITFPNNPDMTKMLEKDETLISILKKMIYQRFREYTKFKRTEVRKKSRKKLKQNIEDVINKYSCYFLVDSVMNSQYYANDKIKCINPGEKADHIVSCMILEKDVIVNENYCEKEVQKGKNKKATVNVWNEKTRDKQACIIHFICTKSGLESRSYGRRLLKTVFSNEKDLHKKTVYGISKYQYMNEGKLSIMYYIL